MEDELQRARAALAAERNRADAEKKRADDEAAARAMEKKRADDEAAARAVEKKRADDEAAARAVEKKRADDEAAARAVEKKRADDEAAARAVEKKRADEEAAARAVEKKRADEEAAARAVEKKRADEEAAARAVEKKRADDEAAARAVEKRRADAEMAKTRETQFFEYLDNIHTQISTVLRVEADPSRAASGKAAKVDGKMYPRLLRRWVEFSQLHRQQFDSLTTLFGDRRLFHSYNDTKAVVGHLSPEKRRVEQDIRPYIRAYLEYPSMLIVKAFLEHTTDPRYAKTDFQFSNSGLGTTKRHMDMDAVVAAAGADSSGSGRGTTTSAKRKLDSSSSLAPDRWGQRVRQHGSMSDIYVRENILPGEYKAVHKVRGSVFRSILGEDAPLAESFMDDCAQRGSGGNRPLDAADDASTEWKKSRQDEVTVAEVLCQAYHYMIVYGNSYGYVTSGEASVFLMTEREDPGTLLYHFIDHAEVAVPITQPETDLVRVPAAQMATLAIIALLDESRSDATTADLKDNLPRWPKPAAKRSQLTAPDQPLGRSPPKGDDNDNDEDGGGGGSSRHSGMPPPAPPAPSSGPGPSDTSSGSRSLNRFELPRREYCTQACLLGLCRGGPLDPACPNVREHASAERRKHGPDGGAPWHAISRAELCAMLLEQFTRSLSAGLECLAKYGLWGHVGTLFKVTLCGYGYTFVAKGVQDADEKTLKEEAALYTDAATQHLQGVLIPVYLGCIELEEWPFCLTTGARIWHMMFLSWAGWSLALRMPDWLHEDDLDDVIADMHWELYRHGIYHRDVREANLAWNPELGRVMALDFDRAFIMTEEEYNETPPPPVTGMCLGAAIPLESKFQAKLQAQLAGGEAKPVAAVPDAPKVEKRKLGGSSEDDTEQKRIRMNLAAVDEPATT